MSLILDQISVTADNKKILDNISLTLEPGELHILTGPNGSGKSTLAQLIAGLCPLEITAKSLSLMGQDLQSLSISERAKLGIFFAFQQPIVLPGLKVAYFLKETLALHRQAPIDYTTFLKTLDEHLIALGLDLSFKARDLNLDASGGEKKRLELLQMLILQPQCIILDETDSGLDLDALQRIQEIILKMRDGTRMFLVITHNPDFAQSLKPERVGVLLQGQLKAYGDAKLLTQLKAKGFAPWGAE